LGKSITITMLTNTAPSLPQINTIELHPLPPHPIITRSSAGTGISPFAELSNAVLTSHPNMAVLSGPIIPAELDDGNRHVQTRRTVVLCSVIGTLLALILSISAHAPASEALVLPPPRLFLISAFQ